MEINGLNGYASYVQTPNTSPASVNNAAENPAITTNRQQSDTLQGDTTQSAVQLNISTEGRQVSENTRSQEMLQTDSSTTTATTIESSTTQQQTSAQPNGTVETPTNEPPQSPAQQPTAERALTQNVGFQAYNMTSNFGIPQQNVIDRTL